MFYARIRELGRSLSLRLTLWYAGLLLLALGLSYAVSYYLISALAQRRVDTYLKTEGEECAQIFQLKGDAAVEEEAQRETQSQGTQDVYFQVVGDDGKVKYESEREPWKNLVLNLNPREVKEDAPVFQSSVRLGSAREVRLVATRLSPTEVLVIAASMNSEVRLIRESMHLVLLAMITTWVAATVLGLVLARRTLRGILSVQEAAANLATGKAGTRVTYPPRGDEVDLLARSFNVMAERIESLLRNLRDTNDHLAHELRSPITAIRGRCELALTHATTPAELAALTADTIEQCDRVLGTINKLLEISETEAGVVRLNLKAVDIHALLTAACDIFEPIAEDKGVKLALEASGPAIITGDEGKLQRLFSNLVDNAIKYTPAGGSVKVQVAGTNAGVEVHIADTGPGIPSHEREVIFARFVRGSGAKGLPGNGLGLSLARMIARAHGGEIHVAGVGGRGATFTVTLPRSGVAGTNSGNMTKK